MKNYPVEIFILTDDFDVQNNKLFLPRNLSVYKNENFPRNFINPRI